MITVVWPAVKKAPATLGGSVYHHGVQAQITKFKAKLGAAEKGENLPFMRYDPPLGASANEALPTGYMGLWQWLAKWLSEIQCQDVHHAGIIAGNMEDWSVGTVVGLSEQISGELDNHVEELALK